MRNTEEQVTILTIQEELSPVYKCHYSVQICKILHTLSQLRQETVLFKETAEIASGSVNLNDTARSTSYP
jgi:hypothetical protein